MNIPENLKYTKEHEWAKVEDDVVTIGITEYAQGELGDIVFVELPNIGQKTEHMKSCASIEAVKAVSDLFAPVTGEVVEVNSELETNPALINQDPYNGGWIVKVKISDASQLEGLLPPDDYQKLVP